MLEQPSTVFVRHSIPILNIQRNDPRFIPIPVVQSLVIIRVNAALSSHLHYFSTVQERNHLFNNILGGLTLRRETGCAVLQERERHQPREKMEWGDTCSTPAISGSLSRAKIFIHSCAMFRWSENYIARMSEKLVLYGGNTNLLALLLILG